MPKVARCTGCEEGCDSCIPPSKDRGPFDAEILLQHKELLKEMIAKRLAELSTSENVYSLQFQEEPPIGFDATPDTILMGRHWRQRDTTCILLCRVLNGGYCADDVYIQIARNGDIFTWDNIVTLERLEKEIRLFEPIIKEWVATVREKQRVS